MKYTSLDTIVRGVLLQTKRPIHYYIDYLVYGQRCLEELGFDILGNVRSALLDINSYNAVTIPCDCMDWVKVSFLSGEYVRPMVQRPGLNRLNNFDKSTGDKVPWPDWFDKSFIEMFGNGVTTWSNTTLYNDHWEMIGRQYGSAGRVQNGFKVLAGAGQRNEIQFEDCIKADKIVLDYISDGSECDNATMINPYAKQTIEDYIKWQYKENARSYSGGEKQEARLLFEKSARRLRSRMNPMTIDDFRSIVQRNTHGSLK